MDIDIIDRTTLKVHVPLYELSYLCILKLTLFVLKLLVDTTIVLKLKLKRIKYMR